jgi:hypothetical protein
VSRVSLHRPECRTSRDDGGLSGFERRKRDFVKVGLRRTDFALPTFVMPTFASRNNSVPGVLASRARSIAGSARCFPPFRRSVPDEVVPSPRRRRRAARLGNHSASGSRSRQSTQRTAIEVPQRATHGDGADGDGIG